ncbi:MotB family protein [Chelativorans sp. ZYF759]|uniref:MotB family protein n=1 Tax=Chelativorans sp. ZYF759 TaxID=2692213 RepID=UPI00145D593C|nr:MotB family protein [Chelativorans sp. ZYF759]NMG40329.1 MotB family protein [Chelativorans sp. ZYF759]
MNAPVTGQPEGEEVRQEIIIVRRGGNDHEEEHHGGVWKIAFADFMTAMMCFFLVMWLVNAANEQTKASVASYFNPVKLMDHNANRRGVDDPGRGEQFSNNPEMANDQTSDRPVGSRRQLSGPADHDNASNLSETHRTSDQNLFADPFSVLAEIARETGTLQNVSARGDGGAQTSGPASGAQGGESYRDPFAPDFWSQQVAAPDVTAPQDVTEQANTDREGPRVEDGERIADQAAPAIAATAAASAAVEIVEVEPDENVPTQQTLDLAQQLRDELSDVFGRDEQLNKTVEITPRRSGVLISLMDELNYGMFEIGSAVPQRQLVLAMEKIAQSLGARSGNIVIMGHTDGRPFRSADYDNWRLSTARAHAAYYMLLRGGLQESRVTEIAGFADRMLKIADNPLDDANRRIELFLEVE